MGGGAWPFLVGGVICLVNSDNERDLNLLNRKGNCLPGEGVEDHVANAVWLWLWILDKLLYRSS